MMDVMLGMKLQESLSDRDESASSEDVLQHSVSNISGHDSERKS